MIALRWITFLPVAAILIGFAYFITGVISDNAPWWIAIPITVFLGVFICIASGLSVRIAPIPKIGAAILLTLFIPLEGISLFAAFSTFTKTELIVRVMVDFYAVFGAIACAQNNTKET